MLSYVLDFRFANLNRIMHYRNINQIILNRNKIKTSHKDINMKIPDTTTIFSMWIWTVKMKSLCLPQKTYTTQIKKIQQKSDCIETYKLKVEHKHVKGYNTIQNNVILYSIQIELDT